MPLSTAIDVIPLKLSTGHDRSKSEVLKTCKTNKENTLLQHGYSASALEVSRMNGPKKLIQSDEIQEMIDERILKFINRTKKVKQIMAIRQ